MKTSTNTMLTVYKALILGFLSLMAFGIFVLIISGVWWVSQTALDVSRAMGH